MKESSRNTYVAITDQLALVSRYAYYDTIFNAVSLLIIVLFCWPSTANFLHTSWAILLTSMLGIRCFVNWSYQRRPSADARIHGFVTTIIATITGMLWGYAGLWYSGTGNAADQIPVTLAITGVTLSSIGALAYYLPAFIGFTGGAALPICFGFFWQPNQAGFAAGSASLLYILLLLFWGITMNRSTNEAIGLRSSNEQLVAELQQQKLEAEEAQHKAEAANIAKSKFLASASHDLRQPLHAMGLLLHALEDRLKKQDLIAIVQQIEHSHLDMEKLFTALLDVSKLDAGVIEVHRKIFSAEEALGALNKELAPMAEEYNSELIFIPRKASIRSDPVLLKRILRNLINNAIIHSGGGHITVDCTLNPKAIDIRISDSGAGIPDEELGLIFSEFHQLRNPERDQNKGLGLGLAIVQRLCFLLGHDILVDSTIGKGTTFTVTVERVAEEDLPEEDINTLVPVIPGNLVGTRILIIDDDHRIVHAMQELLTRWGIQSRFAQTPEQAQMTIASGFNPDIAICDYRLRQNITGVEVLQLIDKKLGRSLPALLITGDTAAERLKEAHASGYTLMHKPVNPAKLRNAIALLLRKNRGWGNTHFDFSG